MLFLEKLSCGNFTCNGKPIAKDSLKVLTSTELPFFSILLDNEVIYDAELWEDLRLLVKIPAKSVVTEHLVNAVIGINVLDTCSKIPVDFMEYMNSLSLRLSRVGARLLATEWEAFDAYFHVWLLNAKDLENQLTELHTNELLAIEMVQNFRKSVVRDEQLALLDKNIYNYLASFVSLVDVARTLVGKYNSSGLNIKYQVFREFFNRPENVFLNKLRNYVLHHKLPIAGQQYNFKIGESFEFKVYADCQEMLTSSAWTSETRKFLENSPPTLDLGRLLLSHMHQAIAQWSWLANMRQSMHAFEIFEYNQLVTEANWAQSGGTINERGICLVETE